MTLLRRLWLVALTLCAADAWGQSSQRGPRIGYLYPAGGQRGSVFQITAGGQNLRGVADAYVSGEGVHASIVGYVGAYRPLNVRVALELRKRLQELREGQPAQSTAASSSPDSTASGASGQTTDRPTAGTNPTSKALPDHPLLRNLDKMNPREIEHVLKEFLNFVGSRSKKQPNAQIGESVLIEVSIDPGAEPGDRELRLRTPAGLTNPMRFQVGMLPEVCERAPNRPSANPALLQDQPLNLPILLNGQIRPGDVDRFRFRAQKGQKLVIAAAAQQLIPYLADAVPGWFQATLALYDPNGKEVSFADDYRFHPDPVLFYEVPQDGEYGLEIRDALYRGREDFVYRIAVGEQPFITCVFPLGGQAGARTFASIEGWNLPKERLPLDTQAGADRIRHTALRHDPWLSNEVSYAVDMLPECDEKEPNDGTKDAQRITLPRIVNGRVGRPGDEDAFQFEGRAGDMVVAEVYARRLDSPLDSLLRLSDAAGRVVAWNDDHEDKEMGLETHHADSYLSARLPRDGTYCVRLSDAQHHGGREYCYRLRIGPPRPDFALRVTPSSINALAGRAVPISVYALRNDGFDGDIELVLKDAPAGFTLSGGRIPGGRDCVRVTLSAPWEPIGQPLVLRLEGRAHIGGETVSRPAVPAEDMMQAFAYRHLVPAQELELSVSGLLRRGPSVQLAADLPVRIPAGGTAEVRVRATQARIPVAIRFELSEPPKGVTLQEVTAVPDGFALVLKADSAAQVGYADSLIVEAFAEMENSRPGNKAPQQRRRVSLGVLPAIPFEIVR